MVGDGWLLPNFGFNHPAWCICAPEHLRIAWPMSAARVRSSRNSMTMIRVRLVTY